MSDFIYKGGDSHAGVFEHSKVLNEGPVMKDAILDYVKKQDACFTAEGLNNSEYEVTGRIKCACGNEKFYLYESNEKRIIKAICPGCK